MILKFCLHCNTEFLVHNYRKDTANYCSTTCCLKHRYIINPKPKIIKKCCICNKEFSVHKYREKTALCCSRICKSKYIQKVNPDLRRKLPHKSGSEHHNWNGGKWIDHQGYVHLRLPNYHKSNPRGYYREHRYIMEQHLGRFLKRNEHVHHINGDKTDNRIENLMLFKNAKEHANHHISLNGLPHN